MIWTAAPKEGGLYVEDDYWEDDYVAVNAWSAEAVSAETWTEA